MTSVKNFYIFQYPGAIFRRVKKKRILAQHATVGMSHRPTRYTLHAPSGRDLFG